MCRYNWHSAGSPCWPFPMLKYKYIFQIKYTEAILSNSTRQLLWFEITKMLIASLRKKIIVSFIIIFGTLSFPTVLPRPRHLLRSQPGVSDGNSPVSRRQQITLRATLIFHLVDELLSTTAAHEVRRADVLKCGSCHLERSARPWLILSNSENF